MGQLVFQATAGGQVALVGPNPTSNFSLNVPAVNGNLVTTGDTGTVTNTMLASSAYTAPGTIGSGTPNTGAFTSLSATSVTDSGLTAGRVNYNGTGGLLVDSANMTFNGTSLTLANDASISGLTVGKGGGSVSTNTALGNGAINTNSSNIGLTTAIGYQALYSAGGSQDVAVGYQAGYSENSSGGSNAYVGYQAGYAGTTAFACDAVGWKALLNNTTGNYNTALGAQALQANTTASNNTAVGYQSLYSNTTGANNSAVGFYSLYSNTTGQQNAALGLSALYSNTTGSYNTAFGKEALALNTTASNNTAVGYQAGYSETTGGQETFVGYQAGYTANGFGNTAIGYLSLYSATTGYTNGAFGRVALYSLTTGINNTAVGCNNSGYYITTGSSNTILGGYNGNQGGLDIRTSSNYIVLSDGDGNPRQWINGNGDIFIGCSTNPSSTVAGRFIGATSYDQRSCGTTTSLYQHFYFTNGNGNVGTITTNGSSTAYNTSSDYRLKENVKPMTDALSVVAQLKPVTYDWICDKSKGQGFIAHELQTVVPDCVSGEKDAVDENGNPVYQAIDSSFLVATLTAAIQEQQVLITDLQARLTKAGL